MANYHVNDRGDAGVCSATKGGCPFGGAEDHYTSAEAARSAFEAKQANPFGGTVGRDSSNPQVQALVQEVERLENNPGRRLYGQPEDEMVRHNIETKLREAKEALAAAVPHGAFAVVQTVVRPKDLEDARNNVIDRLPMRNSKYGWESRWGKDERRTERNIAAYRSSLAAEIASDPQLSREVRHEAEQLRNQRAFARAYQENVDLPPNYAEAFDKLWDAGMYAGSRSYTEYELKNLEESEAGLAAGTIRPQKIVGTGYRNPPKVAKEYLAKRRAELELALATRGRSHPENMRKVSKQAKDGGWIYTDPATGMSL
jgi:RNAse (barnase) inhibitor barstar